MSFLRSFWRQRKVRQNELTEVQIGVDASAVEATGIDKNFVQSVEALGTGQFLITLKERAFYDLHPHYLNVDGGIGTVDAVTGQTVTVSTTDYAGVAADLDFSLGLIWLYTNYIR